MRAPEIVYEIAEIVYEILKETGARHATQDMWQSRFRSKPLPRPNRVHVEGGIYHVYNRLARGAMVFTEDTQAETFVSLLRDVKERDGLSCSRGV